ncbi:Nucleoside-diphosphate-sugar epimerase [Streptoalloteichus tenebrarius]|uniref:Nucleoside-diphosphate-sugar epimerase n=1 Tax=Streptoalloteichus tenebrarius (strain ATCC 17920 / DSM 40477 / JCM 4838 / CBS 697.72 / NBRC 16177 / NCIMB 11028 / NRRL B-12390 / A12253. 1 / ISP 5477) TaxID=1933 RepID=A0ABT1HYU1_STRSD|nr:NAD-dependent epimerase/dehydratase family protein [Streptoalloteichus tenebrarius]MCP2260664.1 Nucleoside-diphosphate-sugar epimerase [Streptoalloteichus tenebrarius]BFF03805.1 NAD-dependent epimerase/dehydratase family protein [Streptoalloteichus tenebrarius]
MRVAVVGASGNIGTAFLRWVAAERDVTVVGVSRRKPPLPPPREVEWCTADVADPAGAAALRRAFAGADAVVNLAWASGPGHDEDLARRTNVDGAERVATAAVEAGVPHLVALSSIGAYSPAPKDRRTSEDWPTDGVGSSPYSRQKAAVERIMDRVEHAHPDLLVTRVRPALVLPRPGTGETRRDAGPTPPPQVFRLARRRLPVLPLPSRLVLQFVHADDVADAVLRILRRRVPGAFNLAAEPALPPRRLADLLGARHAPVPLSAARAAAWVRWTLRARPSSPGWVDLAAAIPLLSTERARAELGWRPGRSAEEAVTEALSGLPDRPGWAAGAARRPWGDRSEHAVRPALP